MQHQRNLERWRWKFRLILISAPKIQGTRNAVSDRVSGFHMHVRTAGLLALLPLCASAAGTDSFELSTGLMWFDRTEFSTSGSSLNRESGFLPGITASLSRTLSTSEHSFSIELWGGDVEYDGQLQNGTPLSTDTSQLLYGFGYQYLYQPNTDIPAMFLRVDWQGWHRDIQATSISARLSERYSWFSIEPGVRFSLPEHKLKVDVSAISVVGGNVIVELNSSNFGEPEVDLGNGIGYRIALGYELLQDENRSLTLGVDHQRIRIDRGSPTSVSNGSTIAIITEPESLESSTVVDITYRLLF